MRHEAWRRLQRWVFLNAILWIFGPAGGAQAVVGSNAIGPYLDQAFPASDPVGGGAQPPPLLSQVGAFTNLATLTPHPGLVPYAVNTPLWSDGALKSRWIAVPNDGTRDSIGERVTFSATAPWGFPAGTVAVKHFEIPVSQLDPLQIRRLETRFIVVIPSGDFYGVTYRWREDGTDADLLPGAASDPLQIELADGSQTTQTWNYPSRQDCRGCHNPSSGVFLGLRTHQLHGLFTYPGEAAAENQLLAWNAAGLLTPSFDPAELPGFPKAAAIDDPSASVETRARSYLDSNCANCHHPGFLSTGFDLRFTQPLASLNVINGSVLYDLGIEDARVIAPASLERSILYQRMNTDGIHRMPPIGRNVIDAEAVSVIGQWILSLEEPPPPTGNSSPAAADDEGLTIAEEAVAIPAFSNDRDADGDTITLFSSTQPTHGTATWNQGIVTYTPEAEFTGADAFSYVIVDPYGATSNTAVVTVQVSPPASASSVSFSDASALLANPSHKSGVAMAVVDMNGDGRDDIVHLNQARDLTIDYQQSGGAVFTQLALGTVGTGNQWGMAVGDADNNGFPDIITGGYYDGLHYLRADSSGAGYAQSVLSPPSIFLQAVNFADINGDGWLDVFACHDDAANVPWRNVGEGTGSTGDLVHDASLINTATTPPSDNSGNYGAVWTDYDSDGDLDLYVSKCRIGVFDPADPRRINQLFRNDGNGAYTETAAAAGLAFGEQSWVADVGDVDNDGDMDCFVGNHGAASVLMLNQSDGTFTQAAGNGGIAVTWKVIQSVFRDFNNDGWLDLLLSGEFHELWLNDGDGTFTVAPNPFSTIQMESCAIGDLNHDGFPDVFGGYANFYNTPNGTDRMFTSNPNSNGFLSIRLIGRQSNRLASGARLELLGPWGRQVREVRSGEGYGVTHAFTQTFGMGNQPMASQLIVRWPSGAVDVLNNVAANQFLALAEGSSAAPSLVPPGNQASLANAAVALQLQASDPTDDALTFDAVNLPPGLTLDAQTGLIDGTSANADGSYTVTVSVTDGWTSDAATFTWNISGADTDGDGIPSAWEILYGLDPADPADAVADADGDGIPSIAEWLRGSHPLQSNPGDLHIAFQIGQDAAIHSVIHYQRRAAVPAGMVSEIEWKPDWSAAWNGLPTSAEMATGQGLAAVEAMDPAGFSSIGNPGEPLQAFYRLVMSGTSAGVAWQYTSPVSSYLRIPCPEDSDTRFGTPLRLPATGRGRVSNTSVSPEGDAMTIVADAVTPNLTSIVGTGRPAFVRFLEGTIAGHTFR
ncbi:MAG: VCBS repeat-containing protein, partial [Verrucomicrobiae bacterium]|nr:VCBS repeat-containing protein [Verrucomicrobiae bacterium]